MNSLQQFFRRCGGTLGRKSWKSMLRAAVFGLAIVLILNPEIRGMLLFAEFLGLETLVLLFATQARVYGLALKPYVQPLAQSASGIACRLASTVGVWALKAPDLVVPFRPLPQVLGPLFFALSYGVHCPIKKAAA